MSAPSAQRALTVLACAVLAACSASAPPRVELGGAPAAWQTSAYATGSALSTSAGSTAGDNAAQAAPWRPAQPADSQVKGAWWAVFHDAVLDSLQQQAEQASPSLQAAVARVNQARALSDYAGGASLPRVDANFKDVRSRTSANRPAASATAQAVSSIQNDIVLNGAVSYELDLFGRQRFDQQAAQAFAQQAQADLLNARLVLSADLAAYYFSVRSLDAEIAVVQQGLQAQTRAADVLKARYEGGASSRLDVAQQQAQLDATRTQLTLLQKQRAALEHALATLVGTPANSFKLDADTLPAWTPPVPVALPSDVLQRRPDVASAERAVAVANAQVGLAGAAWFPSITLSASGGWEARDLAKLIDAPSLLWAIGANVAQTVFDGGRTRAKEDQAKAAHELALANYRQTVLRALQEVEDGLSALNTLDTAQAQSQAAVQSAQKVLDIAQDRYAGGVSTYLDVVTAQQNVLNNQRLSTQLRGQQLQASAYLIKALGGGWQRPDLSHGLAEHVAHHVTESVATGQAPIERSQP
jgi:multidrug efflux system outer membrane protein